MSRVRPSLLDTPFLLDDVLLSETDGQPMAETEARAQAEAEARAQAEAHIADLEAELARLRERLSGGGSDP